MKALGYIALHKGKLLPAANSLLQRRLEGIQRQQEALVVKELTSWNPFRPISREDAASKLDKLPGQWRALKWDIKEAQQEFCQMSEGYVYLDIAVVHKLFGE